MSPIVIKVGGALLEDQAAADNLLQNIQAIMHQRPVVLVHGGGPLVETLMASLGLTSSKIDGLRVTPDEHMPYICGALAGSANKTLCATALKAGITPVGLSLLDGNMVNCTAMHDKYGAVGTPVAQDANLLNSLLAQQFLPVISSIGSSAQGRLLNINADQAATVIAQLVNGELILLSNVKGVLDASKQLLTQLDATAIDKLVVDGVILDGMKVKTDAAMLAANSLGKPVTIASWSASLEDILQQHTGTRITPQPVKAGEKQ
ncbi:acetylglutamate kinase [Alteromonas pelagimontana]|uniref:Acetylglutamate kinase n=1 Tax=Alteromonas pelagimontana TaxID=1858656 RepID=A0A6M4MBY8_9ALTE|nr:acetylglutamate kinase [Alteromonas pelagimontana]QJR80537.1 acetylglutamate kinase [Alteromonas pelagimontana]